jgi:hypothetical protein
MIDRTPITPEQRAVREKVWHEAQKPAQCPFEDEDTVTFTRAEVKALWTSILNTGVELAKHRDVETFQEACR